MLYLNSKKQRMGRRKVELKRIKNTSRRRATFTKRRDGLFKKTDELCNLCGATAAVIAISEAGKCFAFGNPSADAVIERYLALTSSDADLKQDEDLDVPVNDRNPLEELRFKYDDALRRLEIEKKSGEIMDDRLGKV